MALKDLKFSEADFFEKDISSLPDRPSEAGVTAAELKARFDFIPKVVVALGGFNDIIDELTGENGAGNIGAKSDFLEGETVAEQLEDAGEKLGTKIEGVTVNGEETPIENGKAKVTYPTDTVRYSSQSLSEAEKKQARENIGAVSRAEQVADLEAFAIDAFASDFEVLDTAKKHTDNAVADLQPKEAGKGLSEANFTESEKSKLNGIEAGAQKNPVSLPNPAALTFTGAAIGSYDGSKTLNIEIPDGSADAVTYTEQNLTTAQKTQARENIGAVSSEEMASTYQPKESGKGLSQANYTTTEKNKLAGIEAGAQKNPTALPNPFSIVFSGAVNAEYNGSEKIQVNIPTGGGGGGSGADLLNADGVIKQEHLPEGYPYYTAKLIVGESTITAEDNGGDLLEFTIPNVKSIPTAGKRYVVKWNDTEYTVTAADFDFPTITDGPAGVTLGGSEYPFTLNFFYPQHVDTIGLTNVGGDSSGSSSVTFSVAAVEEFDYTPIVFNLLPDGYPKMEGKGVVLEECQPIYNEEAGFFFVTDEMQTVNAGDVCFVSWNGVNYTSVAQDMTEDNVTMVVIGNIGLLTGGADTGEPYIILCLPPEAAAEYGFYAQIVAIDGATELTISISSRSVTPIAQKFLPVGYPYFVPGGETVLEPMWAVNQLDYTLPIKKNYSYIVTWDGADYECKSELLSGEDVSYLILGNKSLIFEMFEDTGEPFCFLPYQGVTTIGFETAAMVSIKTADSYFPIDERYLPRDAGLNLVNGDAKGSLRTKSAAENSDDYTIGRYAVALGDGAKAHSDHDVAIGYCAETSTNNQRKTAIGEGVKAATHTGSVAIGKYNDASIDVPFAIGDGANDSDRHTAVSVVRSNGVSIIGLRGNIYIYEGALRLKSPSSKWFEITVSDDGTLSATAI